MTKKESTVTYSRLTNAEQAKLGYSLESQRKKLREYAKMNNLEIEREFSDVGSGTKTNRQGFNEMLRYLDSSEDCKTILVTKPDRLSRDFKTFSELQKKYCLISVDYGASDMTNQLYIMLAQYYSKVHSKRIKAGLQRSKKKKEKVKSMTNSKTTQSSKNKFKTWIEDWVSHGSDNKLKIWLKDWVSSQMPESNEIENNKNQNKGENYGKF